MKNILLLITITIICIPLFAQNAYNDAIELRKNVKEINNNWQFNIFKEDGETPDVAAANKIIEILKASYINMPGIDAMNTKAFTSRISSDTSKFYNPFLASLLLQFNTSGSSADIIGLDLKKSLSLSSLGALDVTSIADGLAQFLIKRGKEELNIAFFQHMQEFLENNVEAKTLFPSTSAFLGKIASYRYAELLQSLREAFYTDISNLVVNLNLLIDLPKYQDLLNALPEIRAAIRCAKITSELSQGDDAAVHPADLIHQFAGIKEWGEMNINLKNSWLLLDRISESVRKIETGNIGVSKTYTTLKDTFTLEKINLSDNVFELKKIKIDSGKTIIVNAAITADDAWIKFKDFHDNILNDNITLRIYIGLLYQRMQGIVFRDANGDEITVQKYVFANKNDLLKIADFIENFLLLANDVDKSVKEIKQKKGGLSNDDYYTYIQKAINITEYGFKVANFINPGIVDDRYIVMAKNANALYKNIYTKNYNAAVMNAYSILKEVLTKTDTAIAEKTNFLNKLNTAANLSTEQKINLKISIDELKARVKNLYDSSFFTKKSIDNRDEIVEHVLRYGNLIASIVKAENSQEAEAAIEAAVLPAGSSSIKKNSAFNVSLNAYIGGYLGRSSNGSDEIDGNNSSVGVTAPIGIAVSWGLGHFKSGNSVGSLSLYGTIIDVGAIAGYRLNDDSTALDQKITLNDIFTPGGYLVYGLGLPFKWASYVPLSVGYGWQYGSKLYYKKDDGTLAVSDKSRWRSNWFIAIDIPLANFWTRNYAKKK